ncbi:streptophobe family protein [Streptomyces sp. NPDC050504]|uniref:streptophobe family protein n=1 Tax=Streptomyces sp. NPDC050504 TaxID=3365618 RepID=UPI0037BCE321
MDARSKVRWGDVLLAAVASVSWALVGMAGTAALGLHLLGADATASLGPMTAALVVLGAGGSVRPSGDVSVFGLEGAEARTAIEITPLGVGLVGALFLSYFFLRSLRALGSRVSWGELAARAGAVVALFVGLVGGLAWAGHDVITIDGSSLGIDPPKVPGGDLPDEVGGLLPDGIGDLGDLGDLGGLLPDRLADLARTKAEVGFTVDTASSLAGGAVWVVGVLVIALLASRRTPLPAGAAWLHRSVRPAASALVGVLIVAVAAGLAAAGYAAIGDDHPGRVAGAALLGAPNGVWLGVPLGLFVPWEGRATGVLTRVLPDPLDDLLSSSDDRPVTVARLAELDGRVWLLAVAAAVMMLYAGVLAAVRTPVDGGRAGGRFVVRCAVALGAVTAVALPLLVRLTGVSVDASLSVLGFDALGAGVELHGSTGLAVLVGAAWGAGAGAAGALLARLTGAAGRRAAKLAGPAGAVGGYGAGLPGGGGVPGGGVPGGGVPGGGVPGGGGVPHGPGPYVPSRPYRAPNPDTNPYLRQPDPGPADPGQGVHGAPTVVGPITPPPGRRPRPGPRGPYYKDGPADRPHDGGSPPPGPPPPGTPRGTRGGPGGGPPGGSGGGSPNGSRGSGP